MNFDSGYLLDEDIIEKLNKLGIRVDVLDSNPPSYTILMSPEQLGKLLDWAVYSHDLFV